MNVKCLAERLNNSDDGKERFLEVCRLSQSIVQTKSLLIITFSIQLKVRFSPTFSFEIIVKLINSFLVKLKSQLKLHLSVQQIFDSKAPLFFERFRVFTDMRNVQL